MILLSYKLQNLFSVMLFDIICDNIFVKKILDFVINIVDNINANYGGQEWNYQKNINILNLKLTGL